jgi:hypothetical protein
VGVRGLEIGDLEIDLLRLLPGDTLCLYGDEGLNGEGLLLRAVLEDGLDLRLLLLHEGDDALPLLEFTMLLVDDPVLMLGLTPRIDPSTTVL